MAEAKVKPSGGGGFSETRVSPNPSVHKESISSAEGISGSEWYSQEALRAVNQAVGRVIRHRFDYGAVLLLDSRFGDHRNKEGMSKWVRPYILSDDGFGTAISKLAKFYREAACNPLLNIKRPTASDSDSKKKPIRNSSRGLILNYENSIVSTEDEKETKINITVVQVSIKKDEGKEGSPHVGCDGVVSAQRDGYIPADRVIKRIEVKTSDIKEKLAENNFDCYGNNSLSTSCERPGLNAVFQQRKLSCSGNPIEGKKATTEEGKESALAFFKAAQSSMSADEFQALRLLVSKLKDSGDKNDTLAYLTVARQMLHLLLPYDEKKDLVALLMPLLPTKQRPAVQVIAQELRSLVRQLKVKESMSHFDAEKAIQGALFRTTNKTFHTKENELDVKEVEAQRQEKEISLMNAERIFKAAKNRVCDGINLKLNPDFGSNSITAQRGKKLSEILKSSVERVLSSSIPVSKKAKFELGTNKGCHVPFDKNKCTTETHESKLKSDDVDIAQCLQQVSVASFLTEQCAKQSLLRINTNTPEGLVCVICEEPMRHPMVATCNHYACKNCWKKWLLAAQNRTCPVCRMPAEMSKLSLLVFERQTGTGIPSLTQLCSAELASNDDDDTS